MGKYAFWSAILLSVILAIPCFAGTPGDRPPVFYLSFDGEKDAEGKIEVEGMDVRGEVSFTQGIKGEALVVGRGHVRYRLAANVLNSPSGTVAMWIKPIDWDTESYIDFFKGFQDNSIIFRIYRFPHHYRGIQAYKYNDYGIFLRRAVLDTWKMKDGNWHLVVFTWQGEERTLYVDGLHVETALRKENTLGDINVLIIGNAALKYVQPGNRRELTYKTTAIDEVAVYDYAFTPEQAKKAYEDIMGSMEKQDVF